MKDDRQYEDEDKAASKEFIPDKNVIDNNDLENEEDQEDELDWEPECPISGTDEDNGIECEFNVKDGSWWCDTHNCWA